MANIIPATDICTQVKCTSETQLQETMGDQFDYLEFNSKSDYPLGDARVPREEYLLESMEGIDNHSLYNVATSKIKIKEVCYGDHIQVHDFKQIENNVNNSQIIHLSVNQERPVCKLDSKRNISNHQLDIDNNIKAKIAIELVFGNEHLKRRSTRKRNVVTDSSYIIDLVKVIFNILNSHKHNITKLC